LGAMPVFKDKTLMEKLFGDLWTKLITETALGKELKENGISILFLVHEPEMSMFLDDKGPVFGREAESKTSAVTMKMSGDTIHKYWLNQLNVPQALALRQIKAKGPVSKVMRMLPLLKQGQELYPSYCEKYSLPIK
jgi:hypothetical protein